MDNSDNPSADATLNVYSQQAAEFVSLYESLSFMDVHAGVADLLPENPGFILDVGAGSGRDAAWFADRGWEVLAVEPVAAMFGHSTKLGRVCAVDFDRL